MLLGIPRGASPTPSRSRLPMSPSAPEPTTLARELVAENREADAAALLERRPSPAGDALHREIALRAATTALHARNIAAATAWLDRGLQRNPADAALNFFRGHLQLDSGRAAEAAACLRRSVTAEPANEEYASALAQVLLSLGTPAEVPALLAPFADSARAQLLRAEAFERLGDRPAACAACQRAGRLQPALAEAWFRLGALRRHEDDHLGALEAFTRAAAARPDSARAHLERGRTLEHLGAQAEAARAFALATQLDPSANG